MTEFAMGTIKGVRAWRLESGGLRSVAMNYLWHEGENKAVHFPEREVDSRHQVAQRGCSCGFYAYYYPDNIGGYSGLQGVIEGWGRVTMGSLGFRCEKAKIVALVAPSMEPPSDLSGESLITRWAMRMGPRAARDGNGPRAAGCFGVSFGSIGGINSILLWHLSAWFIALTAALLVLFVYSAFLLRAQWRAMEIFRWTSINPEWAHLNPGSVEFSREEAERLYPGVRCYDSYEQMVKAEKVGRPNLAKRTWDRPSFG